jgi:hypothetical protein
MMRNIGINFHQTAQSFPHGVALYLLMPCNQLQNWFAKLIVVRQLLGPTTNHQHGHSRAKQELQSDTFAQE